MATLTIDLVRSWNPAALEASARTLGTARDDLDHEIRAVQSAMDAVLVSWTGQTADAAAARVTQEVTIGRDINAALESARSALSKASTDLVSSRSTLLSLVTDAQARGFSVAGDGSVTAPELPPVLSAPGDSGPSDARNSAQDALNTGATGSATAIGQALQAVSDVDAATAAALTAVELPSSITADVEAFLERLRTSGDLMTALGPTGAGGLALGKSLKKAWGLFGKTKAFGNFISATAGQLKSLPGALSFAGGSATTAETAAFARFATLGKTMAAAKTEFEAGKAVAPWLAKIPGGALASDVAGKAFLPLTIYTAGKDAWTGGGYDGARGTATQVIGGAGALGAGALVTGLLVSNPVGWTVAAGAVVVYGAWSLGNTVYDNWGNITDFTGKAASWVVDHVDVTVPGSTAEQYSTGYDNRLSMSNVGIL